MVQTGDARVSVSGNDKDGWQGYIILFKDNKPHTTLLSTSEGAYPSKGAAIAGMNVILDELKKFDLSAPKETKVA